MNELVHLSKTKLGTKEQAAVTAFCKALCDAPNVSAKSITLYGSAAREDYQPGRSDINILVILEHINVSILKNVHDPVAWGQRHDIVPFFITEVNLRSSADVFPVKFLSMQESYQVLQGSDVLGELEISREHLRLRCEQEIKNLLLRLIHHYIMGGGRELTEMMSRMIVGFLETLRIAVLLTKKDLPSREEVIDIAAKTFKFDTEVLQNVKALRKLDTKLKREKATRLYDDFMAVLDKVAQMIDQMN